MYVIPMTRGDNNEDKGMNKKDEGNEVRTLVGLVIVSGAVLIIISFFIKDPKLYELHYIIRGLGISIIGGAIIAWAIGHLLSKAKFKQIFDDMEVLYKKIIVTDEDINDINENIRSSFKLIKESEDSGLLKIYEPFDTQYKKRLSREFEDDVKDLLSKEKSEIKLYGISLRLFFDNLSKFWPQMSRAFKRMNDNDLKIKILLLSPYSEWTEQRRNAEKKLLR
jgi:flagellar motor component MotA